MSSIANFFRETFHVIGTIVRPTARSIRENTGLAALSVVLAFGIWIVVTQTDNPSGTRIVPLDISVEPINVPSNVAVVEPLPQVRVRVTVADSVFDSLTAADFQATVDLSGLTVGTYPLSVSNPNNGSALPVNVRTLTDRGGLRVDGVLIDTDKDDITLAPLKTAFVDVTVEVQGNPVSGFTMGTPTTDENEATVSGPQEQVDKVAKVIATVDVDGRTDDVDQSVRLIARSQNNELIQGVRIDPEIMGVQIDISQQEFTRTVAVSPNITGAAADGYNVGSVTISPPTVTISGSQALISGTNTILTKSIDLDDATRDVVKTVSLDLPSGAEVTGGPPVVTVTVKIAPAEGVYEFDVTVTPSDLGDDVAIVGALPVVKVTLSGPVPLLKGLTASDIFATIDLSGDDPGQYRKQVNVTSPGGATLRSVNPSEITVTLGQR